MIEIKIPTKDDIDLITFDEDIWNRTIDDRCPSKENCVIPYDLFRFYGFYMDNKIVGLASIEEDNRLHFEVLKPFRKFAREMIKLILEKEDYLYCAITIFHKSVINFAKKSGFKEIGFCEGLFIRNNINYPRIKLEYVKNC